MKKGFLIAAKKLLHALPEGSARHAASGSASLIRRPPTCLFKPSHWAAEGQPASPGRTLRNTFDGGVAAACAASGNHASSGANSGAPATHFSNARRFIVPPSC